MGFKRTPKEPTDGARPLPGVTSENYIIQKGGDFMKAEGKAVEYAKAAGECFMIQPDMHRERRAWAKYFHIKGMDERIRWMIMWLDDGVGIHAKHYAVPAQWPWQFDQSVSEEMCR